jgi:hypothetical protein
MKVAFHFDAALPKFGAVYGPAIEEMVFSKMLLERRFRLATKAYIGDFPLGVLSPDNETLELTAKKWRIQAQNGWRRFTERMGKLTTTEIFVVCFETVGTEFCVRLHRSLAGDEAYLGAVEVKDDAQIHWTLYSDALPLRYRISERNVAVFFDEMTGDAPCEAEKEEETKRLLSTGFASVSFEPAHGKHTLFDTYHSFEHARHVAEWKAKFGDLLGFVADEVICRLGDHIPELPGKLWAAVETYDTAETNEQFAQVSTTCRRILEFVADKLFPPTTEMRGGRPLGPSHYRNRLLAFVEDQTKSGTQIELIASGLKLLAEHVEKIQDMASKGVHSEIHREAARRTLLRTVLLLDDIVALRPESFPINTKLDFSILGGSSA